MENENNPIQSNEEPRYLFLQSPRCGARTRQGAPCRAPAVNNKRRCRMHGGANGSGAPIGSQNALKHGFNTKEIKQLKKVIQLLFKELS